MDADLSSSSETLLKETELRLGLPGTNSPEKKKKKKNDVFPQLGHFSNVSSGEKRAFSDVIGLKEKWVLSGIDCSDLELRKSANFLPSDEKTGDSAPRAQAIGWPPIGSYRKNTLMVVNPSKHDDITEDQNQDSDCQYVKVSMDGAPYLRKVDLMTYNNYKELSSKLETMFSCFINPGKDCSNEVVAREERYVLTYEDRDGDWMLVGDVPWEMFIETCKRLKIMKSLKAAGLRVIAHWSTATMVCTREKATKFWSLGFSINKLDIGPPPAGVPSEK